MVRIKRCTVLQMLGSSEKVTGEVQRILDYVSNATSIKEHLIKGYAHIVLARNSYVFGEMEGCLLHARLAVDVLEDVYQSRFSSSLLVTYIVGLLTEICEEKEYHPRILPIAMKVREFLSTVNADVF